MTTDYDTFADAYSRQNESSLLNAYYERPAMVSLAGDIDGHRVLDAGCGSGPLTAALRDGGAVVTGFDLSAAMIDLARRRLGATQTCTSPISVNHCRSTTTLSTTSSLLCACTTRRTGRHHWRSCVAC